MLPVAALDFRAIYADIIDTSNRIPRFVTDEVERLGYQVKRSYQSYAFAGVHDDFELSRP